MGVDLFFVLSGFLITGILLSRKQLGESYFGYFYGRRARRILAPYLLLLVVSSLLFGTQWARFWYWFVFFGINIGRALHQTGHGSLDPLWSLAVEEQFYLIWPIVILIASERTLVKTATGLIVVAPFLRAAATPLFSTHFPIYFLTPFRMDLLAAGALLSIVWRRNPHLIVSLKSIAYLLICASATLILWVSRYPKFRVSSNTPLTNAATYSLVLVLVTSALVVALSGHGVFCKVLKWSPLRFIGKISYSMYLIHVTAIILVAKLITSQPLIYLISLAATISYATTTWYLFERRLLKTSNQSTSPDRKKAGREVAGLQSESTPA